MKNIVYFTDKRPFWGFVLALSVAFLGAALAAQNPPATSGLNRPPTKANPQAPTAQEPKLRAVPVVSGLEHPWSMAFLPMGRMLVTERAGRMRLVDASGALAASVSGLPAVAAGGQGGLLDVAVDADFANNRLVYWCYSQPQGSEGRLGEGANSTALARGKLSADFKSMQEVKVLFTQQPKVASNLHFGCRIVQTGDMLYVTLGDRYSYSAAAQKLDNHLGKVVRIHTDGRIPKSNPFVGTAGALPEIFSLGHRNMQGAALDAQGRLWTHEHGPQGGDELNRPSAGRNYGWPVITYGEQYGGGPIGEGIAARAGLEQPLHYWLPSIAPSGMAFVNSDRYGASWRGNLLVGALRGQALHRLELAGGAEPADAAKSTGDTVVRETKLLTELQERIRDVRMGPEGWIYILTDSAKGRVLRLELP